MKTEPKIPTHLQLLTITEAAAALRADVDTLRDWCQQGKLEYVRWANKSIRIRLSVIEEFLRANTVTQTAPNNG